MYNHTNQWFPETLLSSIFRASLEKGDNASMHADDAVLDVVTLRASLSGTFLQTLPDLVMPLKGHSTSVQLSTDAVSALRKVWVLI